MGTSIDYNKLLENIDKVKLNKILKNVNEKGFTVNGFANIEKAPLRTISSVLKSKKRQANIFLKEICVIYNVEDEVKKIKNKEIDYEYIKKIITEENKVGLVSALLIGSPDTSDDALELLNKSYEESNLEVLKIDDNTRIIKDELNSNIIDSGNYLCRIELRSDEYYFIKPIFFIEDNRLIESSMKYSFGSTGKIKISAPVRLKTMSMEKDRFYIFNINKDDIYFPPVDENGEVKAQIYENKVYDSKCDIDEKNIFEVIQLDNYIDINEFKSRSERVIYNRYMPISRKIYIENNNSLYGPFEWKIRNEDLEICLIGSSYFVYKYDIDSLRDMIYYIPSETTYEESKKIIYNNKLNIKKIEFDFIDDNSLKNIISKSVSSSRSEKNVIRNILRDIDKIELSDERKNRVINIFRNVELVDDTIDDIIINILNDESKSNLVIDKILKNPNYIKKIDEIEERIEEKKSILKDIEKNIEEVKESQVKEKLKEKTDEIERLEAEIEKKKNERKNIEKSIQELMDNKDIIYNAKEWEQKAEDAIGRFNMYNSEKVKLEAEIDKLSLTIKQQITNAPFNGLIASQMLKAANEFEKESNRNKNIIMIDKETEIDRYNEVDKKKIIEYIYKYIVEKSNRTNFSKNDIVNILMCITQGFITVFAGPPGTGKTSLCGIIAKVLGLERNDEYNRYIEVSVEKGWTSKRDFIGYYNPLTKTLDKVDKELFNAFETLDAEKKKAIEEYPFFILLDEANLSPMEHYWADFMNVCDFDKSNRMINLCEDFKFNVSNTLRFLATINYDHTTEILSPRLIDRSWIVLLDYCEVNIDEMDDCNIDENLPMFSFKMLADVFGASRKLDKDNEADNIKDEILTKFKEIYELFRVIGISVSPRVLKMIRRYCVVGEGLFDDSDNIYVSLDYAVAQKLLPLINGYGDIYKDFLIQLQEKCDKSSMPKCNEIIKKIIRYGDKNMQYYQFFIR